MYHNPNYMGFAWAVLFIKEETPIDKTGDRKSNNFLWLYLNIICLLDFMSYENVRTCFWKYIFVAFIQRSSISYLGNSKMLGI